ncbi:GlsB/YeaQ/YmgE family stress response membrane protein [Verrucomicrobia bacterium LW23]|nr:GlsB/YeaQ/YmgE family stress response membrane protein [Verrucomicrobia bacterium LW23]
MHIIWMIIVGFFVGLIARFLMPGRDPMGWIITSLLGILGSVVATYMGQMMGWYAAGNPAGFLASVLGAMLVLFVYRMLVVRTV